MRLPEICIKKPVLALVLNLLLIIIGIVGFKSIDRSFFPKIVVPAMNVSVSFEGQGATAMEQDVTNKIENALGDVQGIQSISSSSGIGSSSIAITFPIDADLDHEVNLVRDKISSITDFPTGADKPIITVGGSAPPVLIVDIKDDKWSQDQIRDYAIHFLSPRIQSVAGVGAANVKGGGSYAMRIWLDPEKMASLAITVTNVTDAFTHNNLDFAAGNVRHPNRQFAVVSDTRLTTLTQLRNIVVKSSGTHLVRLGDIATVERGHVSSYGADPFLVHGKEGVNFWIQPSKEANPIDVAKAVKKELASLSKTLPEGMSFTILHDYSVFLKNSISETYITLAEALVLVMIVILLFLGSFRAAFIPIATIPFCLIAAFGAMYILGFTINILTLLALVLAIGLVVDDAIVMVENVHRHIEEGMVPFQAALKGSKEIAFPIIVMSLTLVAVYAPIGLTAGWTAMIFKEFAFTLASAVVISTFVALTLSPMLCSRVLLSHANESRYEVWLEKTYAVVASGYQRFLRYVLTKKTLVIVMLVFIAGGGVLLYQTMPKETFPKEDTGALNVDTTSPPQSTVKYTTNYISQLDNILNKEPAIGNYVFTVTPTWSLGYIYLKPWQKRKTTIEIQNELNEKLKNVAGATASVTMPPIIPTPAGADAHNNDIIIKLTTPLEYSALVGPLNKLYKAMEKYPGVVSPNISLKFNSIQYAVHINRQLAADLGVNLQDISDTMGLMLNSKKVGDMEQDGISYPVYALVAKKYLAGFKALDLLFVAGTNFKTGLPTSIPLSSLVTLTQTPVLPTLTHYNRLRSATFTANLANGYSTGQVVTYLNQVLPTITGKNVQYAFSGPLKQFVDSQGAMTGIIVLALIFIYLMLSAQFGSFLDPFIILLTVPLCVVAALVTLWITGNSLSLYSTVGFLTLVGLISKHGILITQFTNNLRAEGKPIVEAVIEAATIRLRPILMTTFAMVFGTLPLALSSGPGSVSRSEIGWTIVGGMLFGTFFSLVVVPVAYCIIGRFKKFDAPEN